MKSTKKYPCQFCAAEFPTKSSRKTHNSKCEKNVNRARNQEASEAGQIKAYSKPQRQYSMSADDFSEMFDDLPDGAFFAIAEEHGLEIEDFI
jgi:hypothetical protein